VGAHRTTASLECRLSTRSGFTVGFADVVIDADLELADFLYGFPGCKYAHRTYVRHTDLHGCCRIISNPWENGIVEGPARLLNGRMRSRVLIEVKTRVASVGDVMRQLFLYRDHVGFDSVEKGALVLATPSKLSNTEKRTLRDSGIVLVHLGAAYLAWKEAELDDSEDCEPELSL
jgi:hypothetical protein